MRTTVDLDPRLLHRLRLEAARRGTSVKALLNAALRAGLDARPAASPVPYRAPSVPMGAARVPLERALRLADALEDEEHARELERRR